MINLLALYIVVALAVIYFSWIIDDRTSPRKIMAYGIFWPVWLCRSVIRGAVEIWHE